MGQRCRAETLGGIIQRLLKQHCIMSAGFERGDGLVVVGLPIIEHVLHGEGATWLLWKDPVGWGCAHSWQSRYQTVRVRDIRPGSQGHQEGRQSDVLGTGDCPNR